MRFSGKVLIFFLAIYLIFSTITFLQVGEVSDNIEIINPNRSNKIDEISIYRYSRVDLEFQNKMVLNITYQLVSFTNGSHVLTSGNFTGDQVLKSLQFKHQGLLIFKCSPLSSNVTLDSFHYEIIWKQTFRTFYNLPQGFMTMLIVIILFIGLEWFIQKYNNINFDKLKSSNTGRTWIGRYRNFILSIQNNKRREVHILIVISVTILFGLQSDLMDIQGTIFPPITFIQYILSNPILVSFYILFQFGLIIYLLPLNFTEVAYLFSFPISRNQLWIMRTIQYLKSLIIMNSLFWVSIFLVRYDLIVGISYPFFLYLKLLSVIITVSIIQTGIVRIFRYRNTLKNEKLGIIFLLLILGESTINSSYLPLFNQIGILTQDTTSVLSNLIIWLLILISVNLGSLHYFQEVELE